MRTSSTASSVVNGFLACFVPYGRGSCGFGLAICRSARASFLTRARHLAREGVERLYMGELRDRGQLSLICIIVHGLRDSPPLALTLGIKTLTYPDAETWIDPTGNRTICDADVAVAPHSLRLGLKVSLL